MSIATLAAWLLTAGIGGYMLRTWIARGGLSRQRATGVGAPPLVIFGHAAAALSGLAIWAGYTATGWRPLAWLDVGVISAAITFGICMVTIWTPYPVREPHAETPPVPVPDRAGTEHAFTVTDEMIATLLADPFPSRRQPRLHLQPLIPVCHGFLALTTFCLATLSVVS